MVKRYHLDPKVEKRLLLRIVVYFLLGAAMLVGVFKLGLPQWAANQYKWVAVGLLATLALSTAMLLNVGSMMTGKKGIPTKAGVILAACSVAALILWIVETVLDKHRDFSSLNLVVDVVLIIALFIRLWGIVKRYWQGAGQTYDKNCNQIEYPGAYVLNDVRCGETHLDPWGKVLIQGNAVLFVNVNPYWGYAFANVAGNITVHQRKGLNGSESEAGYLSETSLTAEGKSGLDRITRIIKMECKKRGVAEPDMVYDYMVLLPRFEEKVRIYTEYSYENLPRSQRLFQSYQKYLEKVPAKYFGEKVCYNANRLQHVLNNMNAEYKRTHPFNAVAGDGQLVADCIAEACELVPVEEKKKATA